jgi:serine protease AprX
MKNNKNFSGKWKKTWAKYRTQPLKMYLNKVFCFYTFIALFLIFKPVAMLANGFTYCFWVPFTDKSQNSFSLNNPSAFLSDKSLNKRGHFGIPVVMTDMPVSQVYVDSIKKSGFKVQYTLKWFNGAVVYSNDSSLIETIKHNSFVKTPSLIGRIPESQKSASGKLKTSPLLDTDFQESFSQIALNKGFFLHNKGFKGGQKSIAIIDAGFYKVNELPAFKSAWDNGRIMEYRDFSTHPNNFFQENNHGSFVFSVIGGHIPSQLTGSAPEASVVLLRSEVVRYEQPIEMYNWIAAAEYADSLGIDIVNTSLGYSTFDAPFEDFTYEDMDGKTAIISKAATLAAQKGMLLVNSAGNEGNNTWRQITAPADADSIIAVGATDAYGQRASFSSLGFSYDGRVKPDVMAMGQQVVSQGTDSNVTKTNGTSLSAPIISGLAACLWSAFPDLTAQTIRNAIIMGSNYFETPTPEYGYGIPDFQKAYEILRDANGEITLPDIRIPTLVQDILPIRTLWYGPKMCHVRIFNIEGKLYHDEAMEIMDYNELEISFIPQGIYFLSLQFDEEVKNYKFIKLP